MAWLAVNEDGTEFIFSHESKRGINSFVGVDAETNNVVIDAVQLPKGTIKKILGYELTWSDEPVEIKER